MVRIAEDKAFRDNLFERLMNDRFTGYGWPHQHELWPCVRRGLAERWLRAQGTHLTTRRQSLYYLRGHSAESLIVPDMLWRPVFVHKGVVVRPDWYGGEGERKPFVEVKSTNMSSARLWGLLKEGGRASLIDGEDFPFRSYMEQVAIYCVALGVKRGGLIVLYMHGDYADRRSKCPDCGAKLGEITADIYRLCGACGYKSYIIDLRTYDVEYPDAELGWYDRTIFEDRRKQWEAGVAAAFGAQGAARKAAKIAKLAPGTRSFACGGCAPGREIKCELYGQGAK